MLELNDKNKKEAINYVLDLYTEYFSEPNVDLGKLHNNRLTLFVSMFNDLGDKQFLVKNVLSIHSNGGHGYSSRTSETC